MRKKVFRIFVLVIPLIYVILTLFHTKDVIFAEFQGKIHGNSEQLTILSDRDDLENFAAEHIISGTLPHYADSFFRENVIIALRIEEPSEDIFHEIISVRKAGDELTIKIKRNIPHRLSSIKGVKVYFIEAKRKLIPGTNNYFLMFI